MHPSVCAGGRGLEPQRVVSRGQRRGVHAAPHTPGGCRQAKTHLHEEVFRVRSENTEYGGGIYSGGQGMARSLVGVLASVLLLCRAVVSCSL